MPNAADAELGLETHRETVTFQVAVRRHPAGAVQQAAFPSARHTLTPADRAGCRF